jgi:hypothetical protein
MQAGHPTAKHHKLAGRTASGQHRDVYSKGQPPAARRIHTHAQPAAAPHLVKVEVQSLIQVGAHATADKSSDGEHRQLLPAGGGQEVEQAVGEVGRGAHPCCRRAAGAGSEGCGAVVGGQAVLCLAVCSHEVTGAQADRHRHKAVPAVAQQRLQHAVQRGRGRLAAAAIAAAASGGCQRAVVGAVAGCVSGGACRERQAHFVDVDAHQPSCQP